MCKTFIALALHCYCLLVLNVHTQTETVSSLQLQANNNIHNSFVWRKSDLVIQSLHHLIGGYFHLIIQVSDPLVV